MNKCCVLFFDLKFRVRWETLNLSTISWKGILGTDRLSTRMCLSIRLCDTLQVDSKSNDHARGNRHKRQELTDTKVINMMRGSAKHSVRKVPSSVRKVPSTYNSEGCGDLTWSFQPIDKLMTRPVVPRGMDMQKEKQLYPPKCQQDTFSLKTTEPYRHQILLLSNARKSVFKKTPCGLKVVVANSHHSLNIPKSLCIQKVISGN